MNLLTGRCKEVFAFPQDRDEWGLKWRSGHLFARDEQSWASGFGLHAADRNCGAHRKCARLELEDWSGNESRLPSPFFQNRLTS